MPLSPADFDYVRELVLRRAAIVLEPEKVYLAEARLAPLALNEGAASISQLVAQMRRLPENGLHNKVVEAMTTNETFFFRDVRPFDALRQVVLPELLKKQPDGRLTFWCGACSSGQEPYSVAMLLQEALPAASWARLRIIGSDLSPLMLEKARKGCYSQMEVNRGLPARLLVKYLAKQGNDWKIQEATRRLVEFRQLNLIDPWPALPALDVIFLRNVLIYFNQTTKQEILSKVRRLLRPGGFLFLGGAETTLNLDPAFQRVEFERGCCFRLI